ncbi:isochorismatase family protein [Leifsonia sp. F6_8S_P_1B]|uniref:Isochorismatase family protein n=1 Tax=Leifsonia williamsii TaxID=3035919 RepID=A0ABT8KBK6_9MICO|nr:isochorismatase family protein [Leifsonia williamsii]MDN4614841.1 isochorismatase family protein [Leifsonia williamsii]
MGHGLLLMDVQRNMLEGETAVPDASRLRGVLKGLLDAAREAGAAVVHVKNDGGPGDPDEPGTPGWELAFARRSGEFVVRKDVPNAFQSNPALADVLHAMGVDTLVVAGMQSELCVQATAVGARERGFAVLVPAGAHGTFDGEEPAAAIAERVDLELAAAGIEVPEVGEVRFGG